MSKFQLPTIFDLRVATNLAVLGLLVLAGCAAERNNSLMSAKLQPLKNPRIEVQKSARILTVFDGGKPVKKYRCCTGRAAGQKQKEGDLRTPEGEFFVCYRNPQSSYTLSLGLSYPTPADAARGLRDGLITPEQHDAILVAHAHRDYTPQLWESLWKTHLGGEVMIHGAGASRNGTAGCVGMNDDDIRELYPAIPYGTPVRIMP